MSAPMHTPGPWSLEDRDDGASGYVLRGADVEFIEYIERSRWMNEIADPEQEANARLIAAAPELLDRLENLIIAIDMGWDLDGVIDAARAAVARAKGADQ